MRMCVCAHATQAWKVNLSGEWPGGGRGGGSADPGSVPADRYDLEPRRQLGPAALRLRLPSAGQLAAFPPGKRASAPPASVCSAPFFSPLMEAPPARHLCASAETQAEKRIKLILEKGHAQRRGR